jgi:integrase
VVAVRRNLERMCSIVDGSAPVSSINAQTILKIKTTALQLASTAGEVPTLKKTKERAWSKRTVQCLLVASRQFIAWAAKNDYLANAPKNLDELAIHVPNKEIVIFDKSEIEQLLKACSANDLLRLAVLLCLNLGAYQGDVADLRRNEIDLETGRITRRRSKLRRHSNLPPTSYKLWAKTLELLRQEMAKRPHPELALVNDNGAPLKTVAVIDGKVKKTDTIRLRFVRIVKNHNLPQDKSLIHLRKTGASFLANEYGEHFAIHYLQHAQNTITRARYVKPDQAKFDAAILAMGEHFGQQ